MLMVMVVDVDGFGWLLWGPGLYSSRLVMLSSAAVSWVALLLSTTRRRPTNPDDWHPSHRSRPHLLTGQVLLTSPPWPRNRPQPSAVTTSIKTPHPTGQAVVTAAFGQDTRMLMAFTTHLPPFCPPKGPPIGPPNSALGGPEADEALELILVVQILDKANLGSFGPPCPLGPV